MKAHTPAHSTDHRITASALDFTLPPELEAHAPAEARGAVDRSDVRLMVSVGTEAPVHTRFGHIGEYVRPGDVLVVNTSAMINAAIDGCIEGVGPVVVHFSAELGHGRWVVELRRPVLAGRSIPPHPSATTSPPARWPSSAVQWCRSWNDSPGPSACGRQSSGRRFP